MATQSTITGTVNRISQIGYETTPGTAVLAVRRLQAGGFELARESEFQNFRPPGFKFDTQSAKTREWASGSYTGGLAYNEFHILCSSALRKGTVGAVTAASWSATTTYRPGDSIVATGSEHEVSSVTGVDAPWSGISGGTVPTWNATVGGTTTDGTVIWTNKGTATGGAFEWTFDMNTFAPDDVQYFTVERGDANNPARCRYASRARLTSLSVSSARTGEVEVSGDIMSGSLSTRALSTPSSDITMVPATPNHLNIYIDDTAAALGTTQVKGNSSVDFTLSDRAGAAFFHGRQIPGIANFVEPTGMGAEANLTQKDDDLVDELLLALQNGQQKFIRYEFLGPEIGTSSIKHRVQIDMCAQIGDSDTESDEDGVFSIELPYRLQHNGTWGRALQIKVRNGLNTPLA